MRTSGMPVLATSVNPHGDLRHQKACFDAWKSAGFDPLTFNAPEEAVVLKKAGLDDTRIRVLAPGEDAREMFGKPVPRVMAVLRRLLEDSREGPIIVANADLFPAIRSQRLVDLWGRHAPVLALTRLDCASLAPGAVAAGRPYRGGLDAFFFSPGHMAAVLRMLGRFPVSERMAFGIPGWDYLLGAVIASESVGGRIADSVVLCHPSHQQSYGAIDELKQYLPALRELGMIESDSAVDAAEEFSKRIRVACDSEKNLPDLIRALQLRLPAEEILDERAVAQTAELLSEMESRWPQLRSGLGLSALTAVVQRLSGGGGMTLSDVANGLLVGPSRLAAFGRTLLAIVLMLRLRPDGSANPVRFCYPAGNRHAAALKMVLQHHSERSPERRLELATLFGAELVEHGIFNARIYNYLALACENDMERQLLTEIAQRTGALDGQVA